LNKLIDSKTYDLKNKEAQLVDCEGEIIQLKNQVVSFQNELKHLKNLEEKYRHENTDLQKRIDAESSRNMELSAAIKDLEGKIRAKEDQIMYMRKELEGARYSNSALLDNNSNLQVEIDSLNNHIRVITIQNEELTKELDEFVQANEAIRQRLDRKARVQEIRQRNEQQISYSQNYVQESRSPIAKRTGERSPLRNNRM
jgi:chromosome segregation ATPase